MVDAVRIATLNLQHGGGNRVKALCEVLGQLDADVLALTEFRSGPRGNALAAWLRARGYGVISHGDADSKTNSVLLAARVGAICPPPLSATSAHAHRVAELEVGETLIVGAYFPGNEIKEGIRHPTARANQAPDATSSLTTCGATAVDGRSVMRNRLSSQPRRNGSPSDHGPTLPLPR